MYYFAIHCMTTLDPSVVRGMSSRPWHRVQHALRTAMKARVRDDVVQRSARGRARAMGPRRRKSTRP